MAAQSGGDVCGAGDYWALLASGRGRKQTWACSAPEPYVPRVQRTRGTSRTVGGGAKTQGTSDATEGWPAAGESGGVEGWVGRVGGGQESFASRELNRAKESQRGVTRRQRQLVESPGQLSLTMRCRHACAGDGIHGGAGRETVGKQASGRRKLELVHP